MIMILLKPIAVILIDSSCIEISPFCACVSDIEQFIIPSLQNAWLEVVQSNILLR